jgi:hypothetical protein
MARPSRVEGRAIFLPVDALWVGVSRAARGAKCCRWRSSRTVSGAMSKHDCHGAWNFHTLIIVQLNQFVGTISLEVFAIY